MAKCIVCDKKMDKKRPWQKFCTAKCRYTHWNNKNPRTQVESTSHFTAQRLVDRTSNFGRSVKYYPYRSKLEFLYAEHLTDCDIQYEYESESFEVIDENGIKLHYIPDFYLPERDTYIEIKTDKSEFKHKKVILFKEQYPGIKYELLCKKDLAEMFEV